MFLPIEEEQENIHMLIEETKAEASRILKQAKQESDLLYEEIELEREAWTQEKELLKSAAHEEGYKEGKEIGRAKGIYRISGTCYKKPDKLFKVQEKIIKHTWKHQKKPF